MKTILIHVKNNDTISKFVSCLHEGYTEPFSHEVRGLIREFAYNGYKVFLTSIDNFDIKNNRYKRVYDVYDRLNLELDMDIVNRLIDIMIVRSIGSVEGNFSNVKAYLEYLNTHYHGLVINNPKAMLKGMTKEYLTELEEDKLSNIGIKKIPSYIHSYEVSFDELKDRYSMLDRYIIKPLSGELSNSISNLGNINEEYLRNKEPKVLGWVVQPIMKEVWDGEYQMMFLDKQLVYSRYKEWTDGLGNIPIQKDRVLHKYEPTSHEVLIGQELIDYIEYKYNIESYINRIDYFKDKNGNPILLEYEMVNPGLFIGNYENTDKDVEYIAEKIRKLSENKVRQRKRC